MSAAEALLPSDEDRRAKVSELWSADAARDVQVLGQYWMAHPMVRDRVNALASGRPDQDPYGHLIELLAARGWRAPVERALSLGCGFGGLERDLVGRDLVRSIDALDLAEGAIAEARRLAEEAGMAGRIRYRVADLEQADFPPGSVDVVFAHSSVHHVERLDELFEAVKRALRPGGVFHIYEFVGATRFQWTDSQLRLGNAMLDSLPPRLRRLPSGEQKPHLTRPTIEGMIAIDPSEAVRSSDILPVMRRHFEILEERALGGALLHNVLGDITQNFRPDDPEDRAALLRLFAAEDAAMADGSVGSDFMTVTAVTPKEHRAARDGVPGAVAGAPGRRSLATTLSLAFPPVRRLYDALCEAQAAIAAMSSEQARLTSEVARLSGQVAELRAREGADPAKGAAGSAP